MSTMTYATQTSTHQRPYLWLYVGLALWFTLIVAMAVSQTFVTAPGSVPWPTIAAALAPVSIYLFTYNINGSFRDFVLRIRPANINIVTQLACDRIWFRIPVFL